MSEEEAKEKYVMMFKPEYLGNRTISAGIYGNFTFSKAAEKILEEDKGCKVSKNLADTIATPEKCTEFRDYVKTNPDFKVKTLAFNTYLVDTAKPKRKTTRLLTVRLLAPDDLAKAADGENLETLAAEESKIMSDNLHGSTSSSEQE